MKPEVNAITDSGNFQLTKKVESLDQFWTVINTNKSIFARHRMYPASFFYSWNIRLIHRWINAGWFYEAKQLKNIIIKN